MDNFHICLIFALELCTKFNSNNLNAWRAFFHSRYKSPEMWPIQPPPLLPSPQKTASLRERKLYAPININPVGDECGQGAGIWCLRLFPLLGFWSCEATPGSGHLTLTDRSLVSIQKRLPIRPSRLPESYAVGERCKGFICFNRLNPIL